MTRINVGIAPSELCDQHLVAEYRELPRLWAFQAKSQAPEQFTLGKGHVLWCAQYPGMLYDRFTALVREMVARGFNVRFPSAPREASLGARPTDAEIKRARPIVQARIRERIVTMKKAHSYRKGERK